MASVQQTKSGARSDQEGFGSTAQKAKRQSVPACVHKQTGLPLQIKLPDILTTFLHACRHSTRAPEQSNQTLAEQGFKTQMLAVESTFNVTTTKHSFMP